MSARWETVQTDEELAKAITLRSKLDAGRQWIHECGAEIEGIRVRAAIWGDVRVLFSCPRCGMYYAFSFKREELV
jgi:hypothetical protein